MSATYDLSGGFTDLTRVRFHTGDTDVDNAMLTDEEITAVLGEADDWQEAVLVCLRNLRAQVSRPDFRADWLQVTNSTAVESLDKLIEQKEAEFGLGGSLAAGAVHTKRWDRGRETS
jgi:hypothetical protein